MAHHDDRVHAYLDGDLPREALGPEELLRLQALEASLCDTREAVRTIPLPDLTRRVMEGLPSSPVASARDEGLVRRLRGWLWTPRPIALRPAYGIAFAAVTAGVLLVLLPGREAPIGSAPVLAEAEAESPMYVQFRIEIPGASQVELAGSFTSWQPEYELTEVSPGVWSVMVPLRPGVHDYGFVVDGSRMVVDPNAPQVDDSFGGSNSRLFLPVPGESARS
jgi:Glycogen recognition site of AMP-activated protein kinase